MVKRTIFTIVALMLALGFCIMIGSVNIPPMEVLRIFAARLGIGAGGEQTHTAIIFQLRLPRAALAFVVGAALSTSGAIMQSVLRNPLASTFTVGVSSGASLGAASAIVAGVVGAALLPAFGFVGAMLAIFIVVVFARKIDGAMSVTTIILAGMVLSLFLNSITHLILALDRENIQRLIFWQMGSFASRGTMPIRILAPITLAGVLAALVMHRQLDLMSFSEDTAQIAGVDTRRAKWWLLGVASALAGAAISFVGIVGFIDLVAPHVVRRIFGAGHLRLIPMSAVVGGGFMMLSDLAARTVTSPGELPVGVITALIGAPFFAWIFFAKRQHAYAG